LFLLLLNPFKLPRPANAASVPEKRARKAAPPDQVDALASCRRTSIKENLEIADALVSRLKLNFFLLNIETKLVDYK
jgi:hypothetical protein